jgi:hypothetical protein
VEDVRALRTEAKLAREKLAAVSNPGSTTRRRKDSSPVTYFNGPTPTAGINNSGYFTSKLNSPESPSSRARSSTTPSGSAPTSIRHGPHASGAANISPRLKHIRRESMRSHVETLPTTLWDYLLLEMDNSDIRGVEEHKKERLSNFLRIPERLEKVYFFLNSNFVNTS